MLKYIVRRVLMMIPTLLVVIFIVFFLMDLTPGSPGLIILGQDATPEAVAELNEKLGYNRPFLVRYADYVIKLCRGDMGTTYRANRQVFDEIRTRIPVTLRLSISVIVIALLIGIPIGALSAVKQDSAFDIVGRILAIFLSCVPAFWLGMMLILLFSLKLRLLPSNGNATWVHYILPALTQAIPQSSRSLRMTRTSMLETIRTDYIRTVRAKGQTEGKVIVRHALKNALLPVITMAGLDFGSLLGGTIVVERVFSINGVGTLILDAIQFKDVPIVLGGIVFFATFYMITLLVVDILYALIDPRIKARYRGFTN